MASEHAQQTLKRFTTPGAHACGKRLAKRQEQHTLTIQQIMCSVPDRKRCSTDDVCDTVYVCAAAVIDHAEEVRDYRVLCMLNATRGNGTLSTQSARQSLCKQLGHLLIDTDTCYLWKSTKHCNRFSPVHRLDLMVEDVPAHHDAEQMAVLCADD